MDNEVLCHEAVGIKEAEHCVSLSHLVSEQVSLDDRVEVGEWCGGDVHTTPVDVGGIWICGHTPTASRFVADIAPRFIALANRPTESSPK